MGSYRCYISHYTGTVWQTQNNARHFMSNKRNNDPHGKLFLRNCHLVTFSKINCLRLKQKSNETRFDAEISQHSSGGHTRINSVAVDTRALALRKFSKYLHSVVPFLTLSLPHPVTTSHCHHLTLSSPHTVTTWPCHHLTLSPPHPVTTSPCHYLTLSPPHTVTTSHCHHLTLSPPHPVTTSPCHHLTLSPPHPVTTSHCHHLTLSPPHTVTTWPSMTTLNISFLITFLKMVLFLCLELAIITIQRQHYHYHYYYHQHHHKSVNACSTDKDHTNLWTCILLSDILTFSICITFIVLISVISSIFHFHYVIMHPCTVPWLSHLCRLQLFVYFSSIASNSDPRESVGKCKNLQTFSGAPFGISITVPSVVLCWNFYFYLTWLFIPQYIYIYIYIIMFLKG